MKRKELLKKLQQERNDLGQRIMVLSNSLYFNDSLPAKDLVREQIQAMDKYFEAIEARILDLEYDIDLEESLDPEARKAFDEAEEAAEKRKKAEPNFIDRMCDELNDRVDDLVNLIRGHNHKEDAPSLEDLEGKEIINANPPHCHECCNDGTGCVKLILPGGQHICVK